MHAFRADPYSAQTWLYAAGGDIDEAEMEKARAEDLRAAEVMKRPLGGPRWVQEVINRLDKRSKYLLGEKEDR